MLKRTRWTPMNEESGGDAGGGGGGGGTVVPGAGTEPTNTKPAGTVLDRGSSTEPPLHERIPEKYRVLKSDGSIDIEASTSKLATGYGELSKRFGAGDVPPSDVAGYKITIPEPMKDALKDWNQSGDEKLQAFLGEAHKSGLTQSQLDLVMGQYFNVLGTMQPVVTPEQQTEQTAAELSKVWKDDGEFDRNVQAAYQVSSQLAQKIGVPIDELNTALGNNAMFLRLAAALAPEMREDTPAGTQSGGGDALDFSAKVAELRSQKDALPEKDPRRQQIQEQINQLYSARYK